MKKGKYVPYTKADWEKWYPGQISEQRRKELLEMDYNAKDLTADDLVFLLSKAISNLFHGMLKAAKTVVGDETTQKIVIEYGRIRGKEGFSKLLKAVGTSDPMPEQLSWFMDASHAGGGLEYSQTLSQYDNEKVTLRRKHCNWYTNDSEVRGYCRYMVEFGAFEGFKEVLPQLEPRYVKCMLDGDDHCEQEFKLKPKQASKGGKS